MMERNKKHTALWNVARRECRRLVSRPLYLFCMVIAPLFCYIFFTTLMDSGLPTDMPVGVVDQDMSATSRQLIRNLDAFEQTAVVNYSVYLCNTFAPGVLMLLIFMVTVYSIGVEIKDRTAREWLRMGNNSIWISLAGKLLPHTAIFFLMGILYNVYLYGFLHFPCNSGILPMLLATLCLVLASQGMGILMIGTLPTLRLGLSFASLWGVLSFSMCGLSFPAMGMHPVLQALANLFPLRHYFLIYVDQALNGYPMIYSWVNYVALLIFMMLPFLIAHRLKGALVYYKYMP